MLKQSSSRNRSVKSIGAALGAGALLIGTSLSQPASASFPFLGEIDTFGFNFAPRGWALCDGQLLQISQNTALFAVLGTTFGGDGRITFGLPDLRGRVAIHPGQGPGLSPIQWGQQGGAETARLTINSMPAHSHTATLKGINRIGNTAVQAGHTLASKGRTNIYQTAAPDVDMHPGSVVIGSTGNSNPQSFSIRDPYLGIYHAIATQGQFPSRS